MKKLIVVIFPFAFLSCRESTKTILHPPFYYEILDIQKWHNEYLSLDSTLINGKIPLAAKYEELLQIMGEPDTVFNLIPEPFEILYPFRFNNKGTVYVVYNGVIFERSGEETLINSIDFDIGNTELINSNIKLNKNTRPIDVQQVFPESGKLLSGSGNGFSGFMMLHTQKPLGDLRIWFLIFKSERLSRAVLYKVPVYD